MTFSSAKINIGTNPNDGTGDNLRDSFFKVNYNFEQIEECLDEISKSVGPEGKSGENGTSGTSGVDGTSGFDGTSGTSGVDGERGPEGKQGPVGPIGPAGLNWKGLWRERNEYEVDDCVSFNGASWFCIRKISKIESNEKTPIEHDNWQLLAAQGAEGKNGLNGTSGVDGTSGFDGTSGISGVDGQNGTSGITPVGPQNYVQILGSGVTGVNTIGVTLVSGSITTKGGPVSITVTGDANPISVSGTAWIRLQIYGGSTPVGNVVHVESLASHINVPYCVTFIDNQPAGTYTYSMRSVLAMAGSFDFGEVNGPTLAIVELTGSGTSGTSGTSGVGNSIKKTKLLNHVVPVATTGEANVTDWSSSYTASGGGLEVTAQISGRKESSGGIVNYYLQRDGVTVDTGTFCFNQVSTHTVLPTLCYITSAETGTHTYSIRVGSGLTIDQNDNCLMVVTEY